MDYGSLDPAKRTRFIAQLDAAIARHDRTIAAAHLKNKVAPSGVYALRDSLQATREKLAASC